MHYGVKNFSLIQSGLADIASLELVNSSILVLYVKDNGNFSRGLCDIIQNVKNVEMAKLKLL